MITKRCTAVSALDQYKDAMACMNLSNIYSIQATRVALQLQNAQLSMCNLLMCDLHSLMLPFLHRQAMRVTVAAV